ncbi:MAG: carboxy terminal-processing peptidase, partial [Candidatus Sedimenticola sp. (ex Thyasira tokunagai)]
QGVDGEVVDIIGWRLQDVVDKIRGPKGTTVRLRVLPESEGTDGRASLVTLVRNKIKLEDQAAKKSIIEGLDNMGPVRIGVIDLPTFYRDFQGQSNGVKDSRSTTEDVRKLIGELMDEGIDGLVIDLRENGGGALTEAVELTGLFIPSGPVVQVKNSSGELEVEQDPDPKLIYGGPLAVLVDRNSASASEIFAGAIQDYQRGIVIGEPTFGKGTVQTLVDLGRLIPKGNNKLGLLRLTMAQFFRINGGSTQFRGVVPDIIYPSAGDSEEHGERGLDNALPWAEIRPASFEHQGLSSLQKYRGQHQARIKSDPGFLYLENQAALLKEVRDRDTVSLKESERKKEWESRQSRQKKLKNSFREAVGLKTLTDEEEEAEGKKRLAAGNNHDDPFSKIMLNEAARILSDYIVDQTRSVMAH